MEKSKKMLPYLIVNIIAFYVLPIVIDVLPNSMKGTEMLFFLVTLPTICFATAFVFGVKHSFYWLYPLAVALLFAPTIFFAFYGRTASVYIVIFGIVSLVGNFCGYICSKKGKE